LKDMKKHHPCIGDIRGKGLFAAIELVKDRKTRQPFAPFNGGSPVLGRIFNEAKQRGVIFSIRWNFFMLVPPLVITQKEMDSALDLLDELLAYADADVAN